MLRSIFNRMFGEAERDTPQDILYEPPSREYLIKNPNRIGDNLFIGEISTKEPITIFCWVVNDLNQSRPISPKDWNKY